MSRQRLGDLLVESGLLRQDQLDFALGEQKKSGVRLGAILVDHGLIPEPRLYDVLAQLTGVPRLSLRTIQVDRAAANMTDAGWAQANGMLPVARDLHAKVVTVAVTDPTDVGALDEFAFRTGWRVRAVLGSETEITRLIHHHFFNEPLSRSTSDLFSRPGHPTTGKIEIEERMIIRDMEEMHHQVQHGDARDSPGKRTAPPDADLERQVLAALKPVFDGQQDAALALKTLFQLCVARRIITAEEYYAKLNSLPDDAF